MKANVKTISGAVKKYPETIGFPQIQEISFKVQTLTSVIMDLRTRH